MVTIDQAIHMLQNLKYKKGGDAQLILMFADPADGDAMYQLAASSDDEHNPNVDDTDGVLYLESM